MAGALRSAKLQAGRAVVVMAAVGVGGGRSARGRAAPSGLRANNGATCLPKSGSILPPGTMGACDCVGGRIEHLDRSVSVRCRRHRLEVLGSSTNPFGGGPFGGNSVCLIAKAPLGRAVLRREISPSV